MWKKVGIASLIVCVLLLSVAAIIQAGFFRQWILARISVALRTPDTSFTARSISYDLTSLRFTLEDVLYRSGRIEVRARRAVVDLPWKKFSREQISLEELDIEGLHVQIDKEDPSANQEGTKALPRFLIDRLRIRDGSLSMYQENKDQLDIPAFSIDLINGTGTLVSNAPVSGLHPGLLVDVDPIPLHMTDASFDFGPMKWRAAHPSLRSEGSAEGTFQWLPEISLRTNWSSLPSNVMNWPDVSTSGVLTYSDGIFQIQDLLVTSKVGRVTGSLTLGKDTNIASATWASVDLSPLQIPAISAGDISVTWSTPDFSDATGAGQVRVISRQYGQASSSVQIDGRRAILNINAHGFDTRVRANVVAGLDQVISGTFRAEYSRLNAVAQGTIRGTFANPRATATLEVREAQFPQLPLLVSASADVNADVRGASATKVIVKAGESSATGEASIVFNGMRLSGSFPEIRAHVVDFVPQGFGTLELSASFGGAPNALTAQFLGAAPEGLGVGKIAFDAVEVSGGLSNEVLHIERLHATRPTGEQIDVAGTFNMTTRDISGTVEAAGFRLEEFSDARGVITVQGSVEGTAETPSVAFHGTAEGLEYQHELLGNLKFDGKGEGRDVRFSAVSEKFSTTVDGTIRAEAPYGFTATVTAADARANYQGRSVAATGVLELAGQLQPFNLADVAADNFRIDGEGVRLEASGRISDEISVDASAELDQLKLESAVLTGSAAANIKVSGSLKDPLIEGRASTENATFFTEGMRIPIRIRGVADFNRNEVIIDTVRAEWGSAVAQITGRSNMHGLGEYRFTLDNLRPEELLTDLPVSGTINLNGTAQVNALELDGIEAEARFTTLDLDLSGVAVRQPTETELRLSNGILEIDKFGLEGGRTRLNISGSADLATSALNFTVNGITDLEVLEAFITDTQIAGTAETNIRVQGQPSDPQITGIVSLADVELTRQSPALIATGGNGTIELQGNTARLRGISADLNDGVVTAGGTVAISTSGVGETLLDIAGENIRWQYPDGLQAEISANLELSGTGTNLLMSGGLRVTDAVYGRDIDITQEVFNRISSRPASVLSGPAEPSALDAMRLDIGVQIPDEVLVLNNLANLQLTANFRVGGTIANPVITGRMQALEGGEIYFGPSTGVSETGRDAYSVEQGSIDLINPRETEPIFNFVGRREVRSSDGITYSIRLDVTGPLGDLKTNFVSDPALSEPDIIALLLTGHTLEQTSGREMTLARNQAVGYLSGVLQRSDFFEGAGSALGLDTVRVDPFLVANETDLGARLTIGKDITRDFSLIFSQGLSGSQGQTWIAQYNAFKGLHLRGINDSVSEDVRLELRHQIDFGGPERPATIRQTFQARRVGSVVFDQMSFPEKELRNLVMKPGKVFSAFQLQKDIESLESYFVEHDYLNVKIRGTRQNINDDLVDVTYRIQPGTKILLEYSGFDVPASVRHRVRTIWKSALLEEQGLANARLLLMRYLADERYFQPTITETRDDTSTGAVIYKLAINSGERFSTPQWVFEGADPVDIDATPSEVIYGGDVIREAIENQYRAIGYINVVVDGPTLKTDRQQASYVVRVTPGPQYKIGELVFNGNVFLTDLQVEQAIRPVFDSLATDEWIRNASRAVISAYWKEGFNDVEVKTSTRAGRQVNRLDVAFDIVEGARQIIADISIEGDQRTEQRFIRQQFAFATGDPVDYEKINETRKKLYDTGLFRSIDIDTEQPGSGDYVVHVKVVENSPWRLRYGLVFTEKLAVNRRELGLSSDLAYSNLFGRGVTTGVSVRYDPAEREVRLFSGLPTLIGHDIRTNFSVFGTRDLSDESFIVDEIGYTIQQQIRMRNKFLMSYDYSYRRNRTYERNLDPDNPFAFDLRIPVARFNGSLTRDTRDDILNARRGTFLSNSFEVAPPGVGSGIHFVKNYVQFFSFRPVKERFTWASAFRFGLADTFDDEELIPSEQFAAGGSTTVRGFKQNELTQDHGNAVFILNQEMRFPLKGWVGGAAFLDAGNVYPLLTDSRPWKLRYSPGVGLRVQTPFVLIRFDVGFNPSVRLPSGEDRYRFSFGIGQAF
jgi:outer membrane protein assembly complex protein YaeT